MRRSIFRKPSLKASFKARTTGRAKRAVKRALIPGYGKKGAGFIKNPKRSVYNAVYHRTSIDTLKPIRNKKRTSRSQKSRQSSNSCLEWIFWIVVLILCLTNIQVTIGFLIICGLIWLIVELFKKHDKITSSNAVSLDKSYIPKSTSKSNIHEGNLIAGDKNYNINPQILPLLYFTDGQLKNISLEVGEPSAISVNLPVAEGEFQKLGYYPSYAGLTPKQRNGFLNWLSTDLTSIPDIGFAFLLLYCLERHILRNEHLEECLKIISKLQSQISSGSFDYYSSTSIGYILFVYKRLDLVKDINLDGCDIKLQILLSQKLSADQLIALATEVDFRNQYYIKEYPKLFKKALIENLKIDFDSEYFKYKISNISKLKKEPYMFSNYSLRKDNNRPDLLLSDPFSDRKFCNNICVELQKAHDQVKAFLEIKRAAEPKMVNSKKKRASKPKRVNPKTGYPMSTDKQIRYATEELKSTREFVKNNQANSYGSKDPQEKMKNLIWNYSAEKMDSANLEYKKGEWNKAEKLWMECVAINYRAADRLRIMYQKEHRFSDAVQIIDFALGSPVLRDINSSYLVDFKKKLQTAERKAIKHENDDQSILSEEDWEKIEKDSDYWFKKLNIKG